MNYNLRSQVEKFLKKGKVVVLGVGNTLRGDDAIGVLISRALQGKVSAKVFDCGEAPENFTGAIRKEKPGVVLIIDAVDLQEKPGSIKLIEQEEIINLGLTTHNMSLGLLIGFIEKEVRSNVAVLGIQPLSTTFSEGVSREISHVKQEVENMLVSILEGKRHA